MSNLKSLENSGLSLINDDGAKTRRMVCIVGLPRSGTSLIASIFRHMGYDLGEKARSPTWEDKDIKDAVDACDFDSFERVIRKRMECVPRLAMKHPRASFCLKEIAMKFPEMAFVATTRDPVAVAMRRIISHQQSSDLGQVCIRAVSEMEEYLKELFAIKNPVLVVSFDKVSSQKSLLVDSLARYVGLKDSIDTDAIIKSVDEDGSRYLDRIRFNKGYGCVVNVSDRCVEGYVLYQNPVNKDALSVEVLLHGDVLMSVPADNVFEGKMPELLNKFDEDIPRVIAKRNLNCFERRIGFKLDLPNSLSTAEWELRVGGESFSFYKHSH